MYWKIKKSPAMVSTELAISITLVVAALFVTLGLFSGNLKQMVSSGNFQRFFLGSDKTTYSAFNRDYSNSAIETIMTGEQGLEQLRKLANNLGVDIIKDQINNNKTILTGKDSNSIEYLALIIKAITGEPHICVYMEDESNKHCNDPEIGGYAYAIESNLTKVRALYPKSQSPTNYLPNSPAMNLTGIDTSLASLASEIITTNGASAMSTMQQAAFVKKATLAAQPVVYKSVLLANTNEKFKSSDKEKEYTPEQFAADLLATIDDVAAVAQTSADYCSNHSKNTSCKNSIGDNDMEVVALWKKNVNNISRNTFQNIASNFLNSMKEGANEETNGLGDWAYNLFVTSPNIINILNDDSVITTTKATACTALFYGNDDNQSSNSTVTRGLVNITGKHPEVTLEMLGITSSPNQYIMTSESNYCRSAK